MHAFRFIINVKRNVVILTLHKDMSTASLSNVNSVLNGLTAGAGVLGACILIRTFLKMRSGRADPAPRLNGRTAIITGSNTGIGYEAAKDFAKRGAKVILACRDVVKAESAKDTIITETGNNQIYVKKIDFASLASVRNFAKDILQNEDKIHILVNNAGAAGLGDSKSEDGNHIGLQVNHFGPFLLTNLLLGRIKESAPSRIVNVSAMGHKWAKIELDDINMEKGSRDTVVYCNSKLCNIITANEIGRRLKGTGVTANSLHPGVVMTEIFRNLPGWFRVPLHGLIKVFYKTPEEGAQTIIHLATSPELEDVTGEYFVECKIATMSDKAKDVEFAKKIWDLSEQCVKLQDNEKFY